MHKTLTIGIAGKGNILDTTREFMEPIIEFLERPAMEQTDCRENTGERFDPLRVERYLAENTWFTRRHELSLDEFSSCFFQADSMPGSTTKEDNGACFRFFEKSLLQNCNGDKTEKEKLFGQILEHTLVKLHDVREAKSFKSLVATIIRNKVTDLLRATHGDYRYLPVNFRDDPLLAELYNLVNQKRHDLHTAINHLAVNYSLSAEIQDYLKSEFIIRGGNKVNRTTDVILDSEIGENDSETISIDRNPQGIPVNADQVQHQISVSTTLEEIHAVVSSFDEEHQAVFRLKHVEGKTKTAIMAECGISTGPKYDKMLSDVESAIKKNVDISFLWR